MRAAATEISFDRGQLRPACSFVGFAGGMPSLAPACSRETLALERERGHVSVSREHAAPRFERHDPLVDFGVFLGKAIFHQLGQSIDGFLGVGAIRFQCQLGALGRPQR